VTTTGAVALPPLATPTTGRARFADAVRSEWVKVRSVRSTTWSLVAMFFLIVGIGILATASEAHSWANAGIIDRFTFDPTRISLVGLLFGQLAIGVLGTLVVTAEYSSGTIRATLAAVPRRPRVLAAKVVVFGTLALVVSEVVAFVAFFIGQVILATAAPHAALGDPGVLRAVVGGGLYMTVLGLLAMGLAMMIRHTAGAITTFVGILLVLPIIVQQFPTSVSNAIGKFLPLTVGLEMISTRHRVDLFPALSPWRGFAVLCVYAAVALVGGVLLLQRRDA
jgi:hypothetical protein